MTDPVKCPVCMNKYSSDAATIRAGEGRWGYRVDCPICGAFDVTLEAWSDYLSPNSGGGSKLSENSRSRLAQWLRNSSSLGPAGRPKIDSDLMKEFFARGFPGTTPPQQAQNIVRLIGDYVSFTGNNLSDFPEGFYAIIGAANPSMAGNLAMELLQRGLITGLSRDSVNTPPVIMNANLTLDGWEQYEAERKGEFSGMFGFVALGFGDPQFERLLADVIKPSVKAELGFDVVDMRDVAQAGVIDNIMRAHIRDAAFVLVDLSTENAGAYWEAGYAEGLGKPVIYLCEKAKFDRTKTHFDTNHCTTVLWASESAGRFQQELIATIRRSLNLFAE
jgi:hypothetical protein